ncbi:MAG: hypothetical protein IT311_04410 [Anaerolineales bacterium]|nr:hypothetical protein [Anaerolineales bacterium]
MKKIKIATIIGLFSTLCSTWAIAPLWINPCTPTRLSEEEIEQFINQYGSKYITLEEQAENEQRYREEKIPCGAQDLTTREKLRVSRYEGLILDELRILRPIILRVEFIGMVENTDLYHYKGYTFFSSRSLTGLVVGRGT